MKKNIQVGIDVGSTTVKAVVIDENSKIIWKDYRRHNAKQAELVRDFLNEIIKKFPNDLISNYITGSGSRSIAKYINATYIQEVNAVTYAVEKLYPDTGSVVELGGQDAKVIIWKENEQGEKSAVTFMNDKCAGGTGATIDKIMGKIGLSPEEACAITYTGESQYHIAAKCGVFAETDVVGLLKAGVDQKEIFISLCQAIVKQDLEVLVRGNVLRDNVLLLGGPHAFLKVIQDIWREEIPKTWELHKWTPRSDKIENLVFVPEDSQYFAAVGAVLFGKKKEELFHSMHSDEVGPEHLFKGIKELDDYISKGRLEKLSAHSSVSDGLVGSKDDFDLFKHEYTIPAFIEPEFTTGSVVSGYLGIDGGSTSSKLVIIDEDGHPIYRDYMLSMGNPIVDVRGMFKKMADYFKSKNVILKLKGTGVTGYASSILEKAFNLDVAVVETVAHMRSSVAYYGETDIICDVGGQDIKVLFMKHGKVVDFKLNTQCSAGNGYFLQGMAEQFNIPIEEYADHAFQAKKAPAFNYGCAVFMEQDKVNFQQLGWSKEEIMAGLALVLPLNIWNYVVQEANIGRFGNKIILQGGTQKNLAAVKAQVDYIKKKVPGAIVHVHKYADICGAIGAAIEVKDYVGIKESSFVGIESATSVTFTSTNNESTRCNFCSNKCTRNFIDITLADGKVVRSISGNGCDKGLSEDKDDMKEKNILQKEMRAKYPNLVAESAKEVFEDFSFESLPDDGTKINSLEIPSYSIYLKKRRFGSDKFIRSGADKIKKRKAMKVGIPRLLNNYLYTPFFSTYLRTLGIEKIVYSDYTSKKLWNEGNKFGAIDPCFPAKVAPAHIYNLLKKDITHICFPIITHLESSVKNTLGNCACVIQMGTPEVVQAVFTRDHDYFKEYGVEYHKPLVSMDKPREVEGLLYDYYKERLGITPHENGWAVAQGFKALAHYKASLRERGKNIINSLVEEDRIGILVLGHPYHHDPGLSHGIHDEFQLHGFPILSIESIPVDDDFLDPLFKNGALDSKDNHDVSDVWNRNFNRNTNLKIWAARVAARHPNLAILDYSSFKCGHDAPTYSYIDNILDASATPHFLFHDIDQNKPGATIKIRIQTIEYFLRLEEKRLKLQIGDLNESDK